MMSPISDSQTESRARAALRMARRVVVKAGTSVVANADGSPSLTRLGAIVEQIAELNQAGIEVIFVSSGAVGMGKNLLRKQAHLNMSFKDLQMGGNSGLNPVQDAAIGATGVNTAAGRLSPHTSIGDLLTVDEHMETSAAKSFAAAGQFELMNLYQSLLSPKGVTASQMLLTQADFHDEHHLKNLRYAVERLLSLGIVPIINENDAVSVVQGYDDGKPVFTDNDSLAALCARTFGAEVLLLLTDVEGVFNMPPSNPKAKLLPFYHSKSNVSIGEKSAQGRGGMAAKIEAAQSAVRPGSNCAACVIAAGSDLTSIRSILSPAYDPDFGPAKGTLFATSGSDLEKLALEELVNALEDEESCSELARDMAIKARKEARKLMTLPHATRQSILNAVADALVERQDEIMQANQMDLEAAQKNNTSLQLVRRLKLTPDKSATLESGIRQLAAMDDHLGVVKAKRELSEGLELSLTTVPIGVLMVIFESRPDSLPQIASLALASGNGLLLKGGKEAHHSNTALHEVIGDAIERGSNGEISRDIVALVTTRGQVKDLLALDDTIDLVIPRGSNSLVSYIKANTRIPVLGHADGVCHVYVDKSAKEEDACRIAVDSKTHYPSACNAMETLLLHKDTLENNVALNVLQSLRSEGVKCLGGPKAMQNGLCDLATNKMKEEYGDLVCLVEIVDSVDEAIDWIHRYGSGHTEAIVCDEQDPVGEEFLMRVDAACVFKNTSTRFADGYRLGLGAEVGVSTGRIHARGPVGVEGLLTTKWQLRSSGGVVNLACEFDGAEPKKTFTHKELIL
ncbi:Gamma-glutamyl phosphate reductase [Seminavis robusta]|uniref:Delta-1-pyrroline-5-carboxylate synthase n=1 Tax=Seminavis robusta TaxID=568900 RepID=A0A9N8HDA2_9STRA|nr:Gamma-glutamyl phosphate reductase [Seminavis robusta]|eukprot:Sro251_g099300.1 Gamma-glutamyl phosphate reductase (796) ;mRNA; f:43336-45822